MNDLKVIDEDIADYSVVQNVLKNMELIELLKLAAELDLLAAQSHYPMRQMLQAVSHSIILQLSQTHFMRHLKPLTGGVEEFKASFEEFRESLESLPRVEDIRVPEEERGDTSD